MDADKPRATQTREIDTLPSLRFDADDYKQTDRIDAMNAVYSGLKECARVKGGSEGVDDEDLYPTLSLRAWSLGTMAASWFESSQLTTKATDRMDPDLREMLYLRLISKGRINAESGDQRVILGPGQIYLGHATHTLHRTKAASGISLRIPYEDVGYDPCFHPRIMSFGHALWIGRVVEAAMHALFEALPTMKMTEAQSIQSSLTALVRALLKAGMPDDESYDAVQSARAAAMKRYVVAHLREEGLNVLRLQVMFGASRSTVYRAFEDVGGVARFVREQRLHAIYRELCASAPKHGIVRKVAEKYGLWDQTAFSRAFRGLYGVRPSDVIGVHRLTDDDPSLRNPNPSRHGVVSLASFWSANSAHRMPLTAA
ncbi:MAG: AraC family transcriptional regulator [Pseudomonadota bacterium]